MKYIDDKIAEFCKNPNEHFFKLSQHSDQVCGSQGFWKATLSASMVALFLTTEEQFCALLSGDIEMIGFFCTVTGKFYMKDSFLYAFHLKEPSLGLPFHYEPIPVQKMKEKLVYGIAEKMRSPALPDGFDLDKEETYEFASYDFFSTEGNYKATPGKLYEYVSESNLVSEIPKFLANPDKWVQTMYGVIARDESMMSELTEEMKRKSEIQAICEMIRDIPEHPWNRILRFQEAINDKSTVVVRLKKGDETCEFRLPVDRCNTIWHYYADGSEMPLIFADYCKPIQPAGSPVMKGKVNTGKTFKWAKQFLGNSFILIKDIDSVLYRGKEIYKWVSE